MLYLMMALAAWIVWKKTRWETQKLPLGWFLLHLGLNSLWSVLFFGLQQPGGIWRDSAVVGINRDFNCFVCAAFKACCKPVGPLPPVGHIRFVSQLHHLVVEWLIKKAIYHPSLARHVVAPSNGERSGVATGQKFNTVVNAVAGVRDHLTEKKKMAKAIWNNAVIAESDHTEIVDGNHYFPPEAIDRQYFRDNSKTTGLWLERDGSILRCGC